MERFGRTGNSQNATARVKQVSSARVTGNYREIAVSVIDHYPREDDINARLAHGQSENGYVVEGAYWIDTCSAGCRTTHTDRSWPKACPKTYGGSPAKCLTPLI
jgi:hypothetical protein